MLDRDSQRHAALTELSAEELAQLQGGEMTNVEYAMTVTDTQTSEGTLIPVRIKHNL